MVMLGAAYWIPTTAEMTEMAGVKTPSPIIMEVDSSTMVNSSPRAPLLLRKNELTCMHMCQQLGTNTLDTALSTVHERNTVPALLPMLCFSKCSRINQHTIKGMVRGLGCMATVHMLLGTQSLPSSLQCSRQSPGLIRTNQQGATLTKY